MLPSLPQYDPELDQRRARVAADRALHKLSRNYGGIPFVESVPLKDEFGAKYLAAAAKWQARSYTNIAATGADALRFDPNGGLEHVAKDVRTVLQTRLQRAIWGPARDVRVSNWRERTPLTVAEYRRMFPTVDPPESMHYWQHDWFFAWERLAGTNPILIQLATDIPHTVPFSAADYRAVMQHYGITDSLDTALGELRIFKVDLAVLEGIDAGMSEGWRKWLYPPIALFALRPDRQRLLPIAIQCTQRPSPKAPVLMPMDGWAWKMARTVVQSADSNQHGVVEHGTLCHILVAIVATCMHRTMASNHPLRVLLSQNLRYTLPLDKLTKELFEPGGRTPTIQSPTVDATLRLSRRGLAGFDWTQRSPPLEFSRRRVDNPEILPEYPYRDDSLPHWHAIVKFCEKYVRLYYASDRDVLEDAELQEFIRELSSEQAGSQKGIGGEGKSPGEIHTIESLYTFVAQIIWRTTTYHAVINYSVWPSQGFLPNCPMAIFAPAPTSRTGYQRMDFESMLPPRATAYKQFNDVFVVGNLRIDKMGDYPLESFADRRVRPFVVELQAALEQIEFDVQQRNKNRPAPYNVLRPSKVPNSVYI